MTQKPPQEVKRWKIFEEPNGRAEVYCLDCKTEMFYDMVVYMQCPSCKGVLPITLLAKVPQE